MQGKTSLLEVGKPYGAPRRWPEGGEFNCRAGGLELLLRFGQLSRQEIDDCARGECEFAILVEGLVVFFLYRFGKSIRWSDAPYSWWLVPEDQRTPPTWAPGEQSRQILQVVLLDAANGTVKAIRAVSLPPPLSAAIDVAVRSQASTPWVGQKAFDAAIAAAYTKHTKTESMVAAATARSKGGE